MGQKGGSANGGRKRAQERDSFGSSWLACFVEFVRNLKRHACFTFPSDQFRNDPHSLNSVPSERGTSKEKMFFRHISMVKGKTIRLSFAHM